ncbi:hypothetical protein [Rhizobium sp. RCAM05973]|uniref:hypothetical protein n=1 Tax=Rhizobium sp. RCAM05973 TaxID=2994066 RepID=UPI0022EBAD6B|nr:hypothetical protein [Rhizobium sp. RCAM05973]
MSKFKIGDRVRRHSGGTTGYFHVGDTGTVSGIDSHGDCFVTHDNSGKREFNLAKFLELVETDKWVPKVGDRVRMTRSVDGHKSECGATIIHKDGTNRQPFVIAFDERQHFGHSAEGRTKDGFGYWVDGSDIELLPVPAAFQIEAGKFYKTRDGSKVGPMRAVDPDEFYDPEWKWRSPQEHSPINDAGHWHVDHIQHPKDLVAEWIDEPAVAIAAGNDNASPVKAKFKVDDRIVAIRNSWSGDVKIGDIFTVIEASAGNVRFVDRKGQPNGWADSNFNLFTGPTAIVALIENGQPKPSAAPFVHGSVESAEKEAVRLAGKHRGKKFGVYVLSSTEELAAPTYEHEWQRLAAKGEKINAINELRRITGLGLKPTKDAVEYWLTSAA